MIEAHNKAIRARPARINKADKVAKQVREAVTWETRVNRVEQVVETSKVNPVSRVRAAIA